MSGLAARRWTARLAIFAVLFQAVLFGWHHHELDLPSSSGAVAAFAAGGVPLTPATAEDGCEICLALHHLSAAPGEFVALALPPAGAPAGRFAEFVFVVGVAGRGFQARAPPVA